MLDPLAQGPGRLPTQGDELGDIQELAWRPVRLGAIELDPAPIVHGVPDHLRKFGDGDVSADAAGRCPKS